MGAREKAMRDCGAFTCPAWCLQPSDEHQYEEHVSEWEEHPVGGYGDVARLRMWASWHEGGTDYVEVEWRIADNSAGVKLTPDEFRAFLDLVESCENQMLQWPDEIWAYDGAEVDIEEDQQAE